jgi:hypothetical protein
MKKLIHVLTMLFIVSSLGFMQNKPKNNQVLEFDSERDLKKYMKSISKDLGVKCNFCHDLNDKSIDTPHKKIARGMMQMQNNLNNSFFAHLGDSLDVHDDIPQISCWTCHRGSKNPQTIKPKK